MQYLGNPIVSFWHVGAVVVEWLSSWLAEQEVRVWFPVSPLEFQRPVISFFQVAIWLKYPWSDINPHYNQPTNCDIYLSYLGNEQYLFEFVMDFPVEFPDREAAESEMGTHTQGWSCQIWLILVWHYIPRLESLYRKKHDLELTWHLTEELGVSTSLHLAWKLFHTVVFREFLCHLWRCDLDLYHDLDLY